MGEYAGENVPLGDGEANVGWEERFGVSSGSEMFVKGRASVECGGD